MSKTVEEILAGLCEEDRTVMSKHVQSEADRRATLAIRTHSERHPSAGQAAEELAARLGALEKAHGAYKARMETRFQVFKLAVGEGVPFSMVEDAIDLKRAKAKIEALKRYKSEIRDRTANELLTSGAKPGSGNGAPGTRDASTMTRDERLAVLTTDPAGFQELMLKSGRRQGPRIFG